MRKRFPYAEMVGQRFGEWTVLSVCARRKIRLAVRCSCGVERDVDAHSVVSGRSQRCRACSKALAPVRAMKHGHSARGKVTPEWNSWRGMVERCTNPKHESWESYGGRGIAVCERWLESFEAFLEDMGPRPARHTIDRKDNARGYEPGNCRWATHEEQARNRRSTRLITIGNETLCAEDWAKRNGVSPSAVYDRLRRGWPAEKAVMKLLP